MQPSFISSAPAKSTVRPRSRGPAGGAASTPVAIRPAPLRRLWIRKLHAFAGLLLTLNMLIILATGLLVQHRERFHLDERLVSRFWLPDSYRPQDGPEGVRADIVITDLHSGRIFGPTGVLVVDGLALGWLLLLLSGVVLYFVSRWRKENGAARNGGGWYQKT